MVGIVTRNFGLDRLLSIQLAIAITLIMAGLLLKDDGYHWFVAFALFLMIRSVNRVMDEMHELQKAEPETATAPEVPTDPQLDVLKEILAELKRGEPASPSTSH